MIIAGLAASNICTLRHPVRFPDQVGPLLALEEQAANAMIFDPIGVPDLLQTESYVQATLSTLDTPACDHIFPRRNRYPALRPRVQETPKLRAGPDESIEWMSALADDLQALTTD
ncbi:Scr1 family TA system antitoxin-like transcriptional regulator [Amycolatopsis japonica]|uniref:Scr1 family TA system antitoxin-like transcriptional regulator n=1 Tax=Amycolatopsis japonica TaxID=208439 RepID=UPI0033D52D69